MNTRVICINYQDRPNEVPNTRWIKKGEVYHIIQIDKLNAQGGLYGCKLAEINNDDLTPYEYFRLDRFAVPEQFSLESAILEEIDISELEEILEEKVLEAGRETLDNIAYKQKNLPDLVLVDFFVLYQNFLTK